MTFSLDLSAGVVSAQASNDTCLVCPFSVSLPNRALLTIFEKFRKGSEKDSILLSQISFEKPRLRIKIRIGFVEKILMTLGTREVGIEDLKYPDLSREMVALVDRQCGFPRVDFREFY